MSDVSKILFIIFIIALLVFLSFENDLKSIVFFTKDYLILNTIKYQKEEGINEYFTSILSKYEWIANTSY